MRRCLARVHSRLVLALLLAVTSGTGFAADVPVVISLDAVIEGRALQLRGDATVPDGAWMIFAAYSREEPKQRATDFAEVRDERFATRIDVSDWPPGEIVVDAHFQVMLPGRKQPDAVVERFGSSGEHMTGKQVVQGGGGFRAAVVSLTVVKE